MQTLARVNATEVYCELVFFFLRQKTLNWAGFRYLPDQATPVRLPARRFIFLGSCISSQPCLDLA